MNRRHAPSRTRRLRGRSGGDASTRKRRLWPRADVVPYPARHLLTCRIKGPRRRPEHRARLHLRHPPRRFSAGGTKNIGDEGRAQVGIFRLVVVQLPNGMDRGADEVDHLLFGPGIAAAEARHVMAQGGRMDVGRVLRVVASHLVADPDDLVAQLLDAELFPIHGGWHIRPVARDHVGTDPHLIETVEGAEPALVEAFHRSVAGL